MSPEDQKTVFGVDKLSTAYQRKKQSLKINLRLKSVHIIQMSQEKGHFARDCPKAHNIARESEQKGKSESMLDLDSTSVSEECATVCTELQYEDASKDQVVYGDQGISAEEYEKATYGDFTKTQSKEEDEVKCTVRQKYWSKYSMV